MKQSRILSLLAVTMLLLSVPARAQQTLTVYDDPSTPATSDQVPAYLYYWDDFTRSQFVIPSDSLSAMRGGTISALTFYTTSQNVPYTSTSVCDVYLKEVSSTTLSAYVAKSTSSTVYSGTVNIVATSDGGTMTVTFSMPYSYGGGNLLIGIENTTDAEYKNIYFRGKNVSGASGAGYDASSLANVAFNQQNFIPKTTFTYSGGGLPLSTIVIGGSSSYNPDVPTACEYRNSVTQFIYTSAELVDSACTINSITFLHSDTPDLGGGNQAINRSFQVYITPTTQSDYSNASWVTVSSNDYVGSDLAVPGVSSSHPLTFTLYRPFAYDGTSNLAITVVDNNSSHEDFHYFRGDNTGSVNRSLYKHTDNASDTYSNYPLPDNPTGTKFRPQVTLGISAAEDPVVTVSGPTTGIAMDGISFTCTGLSSWDYGWDAKDCYISSQGYGQGLLSFFAAWRVPGTYRVHVSAVRHGQTRGEDSTFVTISRRQPEATIASTAQWFAAVPFSANATLNTQRPYIHFTMQQPEEAQAISTANGAAINVFTAEYADGNVYVVKGGGNKLYRHPFNAANPSLPATSDMVEVGPVGNVRDMSYNTADNTMYGIVQTDDGCNLVSINLTTGAVTAIGDPVTADMRTLAVNATGQAYSIATDGNLYSVNLATGTFTLVGATGLDVSNSNQGMSFDRATGELFWAQYHYESDYNYSDGLYKVNTATGHAEFVGFIYNKRTRLTGLFNTNSGSGNGIGEVSTIAVTVQPNPTTGLVRVETAEQVQRLEVYNITGSLLQTVYGNQVDLGSFAEGTYLLRVTTTNGTAVQRVVRK